MSFKQIKVALAAIWSAVSPARSIAAKTWLLYVGSVFLLMVLGVCFQYWLLVRVLEDNNAGFVADEVHDLAMAVQSHGDDAQFIRQEVEYNPSIYLAGGHELFYSRILDEGGATLFESGNMAGLVPASEFPPPDHASNPTERPRLLSWKSPVGRSYLLMSGATRIGVDGPRRAIQVALDKTEERKAVENYARTLLGALLVGTLLAGLFGGEVVRRAIRPLREFGQVASGISPNNLSVRVGARRWPDELQGLAQVTDQMLDRIEDGYARLARLSAETAHELRSPIQVLTGRTEVALSKERWAAEYREILESNLEEFRRLTLLINGLLFLARVQGPEAIVDRTRFDARKELEAIREFHEALAEEIGVSVVCKGHGQLRADRMLVRRAVTNLVSNALQNTPRGGQIVLSVEQSEGHNVLVKVSDTGHGIPLEKIPSMWDRRPRSADSTVEASNAGPGPGLAMVEAIADLHGGTASADSPSPSA